LSVREPATSCTTCGAALLPAEVLYDRRGEVVCLACFGEISGPSPAPVHSSWWGRAAAVRTPQERRGSILRWSLLFAVLAASTLQVRHFALIRLHMVCPPVSIDAPLVGALVPSHLVVRGHVTGSTATRPLWLLARTIDGCAGCLGVVSKPVIADPFGAFTVAMDLPGARHQAYVLQVVSVDQGADGWLTSRSECPYVDARLGDNQHQGTPGRRCRRTAVDRRSLQEGAAVLSSGLVFLAEDRPASSVRPDFEDGFDTE
jgi:hypothetical protein